MKFKGTIAAILSATLICTATAAAMAVNSLSEDIQNISVSAQQEQRAVQGQKLEVTAIQIDKDGKGFILAAPVTIDGKAESGQEVRLNISKDTVYLDTQSVIAANPAEIQTGDVIYAYYSAASTRSLPRQVACYAVAVNLSEKSAPAHYLTAEKITENKDGSITVLTQNSSMLVTIGKDAKISPYLSKNIVTLSDIKVGTRFFAWYDVVAMSYPGQAGTDRVVLLPDIAGPDVSDPADKGDNLLGLVGSVPYRNSTEATVTKVNTATHEGDITLVPSVTVQIADGQTYVVNLGELTWMIDGQNGEVLRWVDVGEQTKTLQKGAKITVWYGSAVAASEPAQIFAEAIGVHMGKELSSPHVLTAENATHNQDGSVTFLTNNGATLLTVPRDTPIVDENGGEVSKISDIRMGTQLIAWYGIETCSFPGQATAEKVMLLPVQDRELTMVSDGDIAIGKAKIQDGVVMVPLRLVAEKLGFAVTWNGAEKSVHLTNGTVQTKIQLGQDAYYKSTAVKGAVGMTASFPLGAASYEVNGTTWAPVEVFNLLLGDQTVRLYGDIVLL